jgi:hypothetical protein
MIQIQSEQQLTRAIAKARKMRPLVRVTAFRFYVVTNKLTGAEYLVNFEKRDGQRLAWCTCKGGESGRPCYHLVAALSRHLQLAQEKATLIF